MLDQTATEQDQPLAPVDQPIEAMPAVASEAVPAAQVEAVPFEFQSDDDIRALAERSERLRTYMERQRLDAGNAARQQRDRELRLERGNAEVAQAWEQQILRDHGVELDDNVRRELPLVVQANREAERALQWRTSTEAVLDAFDVRERDQITAALDGFDGNADQMEQLARQVIDTAVSRTSSKRIADLTLADIPENSTLHGDLRKHIEAEVAKEIEAREAEARASNAPRPPRTPAGGQATTRTQADYADLSPQQIADLPDDEYRLAMGYPAA